MEMLRIGLAQTRQTDDFDANAETVWPLVDEELHHENRVPYL